MLRFAVMWVIFMALFFIGTMGLEMTEGLKIGTTEYYGLRNIGVVFLFATFIVYGLPASALYVAIVIPASVLLRQKNRAALLAKIAIFTALGCAGGKAMFDAMFMDHLVDWYELNENTAVAIFGACGLAYALIDVFSARGRRPDFIRKERNEW